MHEIQQESMQSEDADLQYGPSAVAPDPVADQIASNLNASGRNTLFCCLSCGMPFSFPDDSYTSSDKDVQDIIRFVHRVRREVRKDDRSRASTMQWQVRTICSAGFHRFTLASHHTSRLSVKQEPLPPQVSSREHGASHFSGFQRPHGPHIQVLQVTCPS